MGDRPAGARQALPTSRARGLGLRAGLPLGLGLAACVLVPVVPIVAGALLIAAVAIHAALPEMRPFVEPVLRVPVGRARARYARLAFMAGVGVLCIAGGSLGASLRGKLSGERGQREREHALAVVRADELLAQAAERLATGDVGGAELVLLEADALVGKDAAKRAEIDDLLARVRRSGDPDAILAILTGLPRAEFDAFKSGRAVPDELAFGERALDRRAVALARARIDEAETRRARR